MRCGLAGSERRRDILVNATRGPGAPASEQAWHCRPSEPLAATFERRRQTLLGRLRWMSLGDANMSLWSGDMAGFDG